MTTLINYLLTVPAALIALIVHELCHGLVAYKLGDPTARNMGRLTLNPLHHLDPIGTICMIFFRFGWARPVPINPRYFKKPKRDIMLTALAGPASNLLLAFFSGFFYLLFQKAIWYANTEFLALFLYFFALFFGISHIINLNFMLFNLIPLPPLDGSRVLSYFLSPRANFKLYRYSRYYPLLLIGAMLFLSRIGLNPIAILSGIISDLILSLFALLPIF